jgi:hypothetical protein
MGTLFQVPKFDLLVSRVVKDRDAPRLNYASRYEDILRSGSIILRTLDLGIRWSDQLHSPATLPPVASA